MSVSKEGSQVPFAESGFPRGIHAASLTPLRDDLCIDGEALARHCSGLLENGCDGVGLFGTTGEASSFTREERMEALDTVVDTGVPARRILVGTGCCAAADTVELTKHATSRGVGGVLILPPFYYKNVTDEGILESYRWILERAMDPDLRVYLYHFPRMTGVGLGESVIESLLGEFPGVVRGIKDSSGDWAHLRSLCERFGDRLEIYPGSEEFLLDGLRFGASGCISATLNVTAELAAVVYRSYPDANVLEMQTRLSELRGNFEQYPLISALKFVMHHRTGGAEWLRVRPPLTPLPPGGGRRLLESLLTLGFMDS